MNIEVDKDILMTLLEDASTTEAPPTEAPPTEAPPTEAPPTESSPEMVIDEEGNLILGIRTIKILGNKDYTIKFTPQTVSFYKEEISSIAGIVLNDPMQNAKNGICHVGGPNNDRKYFWMYEIKGGNVILITVCGVYEHKNSGSNHDNYYEIVKGTGPGQKTITLT